MLGGMIYCIKNLINSKVYIGQTRRDKLYKRTGTHFRHASRGRKHPLYAAIRKYGRLNFAVAVLVSCDSLERLGKFEEFYIRHFKSTDREYGYNLASGGLVSRGWHLSKETKVKISEGNIGKKGTHFGPLPFETRVKMSLAKVGKAPNFAGHHHTKEAKRRISRAHKGNSYGLGYRHTKEAKLRIGKATKLREKRKRLLRQVKFR